MAMGGRPGTRPARRQGRRDRNLGARGVRRPMARPLRDGAAIVNRRGLVHVLWLAGLEPLELKLLLSNHLQEAVLSTVSQVCCT